MNPAFESLGQATPAPCTTCGAPMALTAAAALHQNPELFCRHCGQREALPADAAELHRHLRLRLMQLTRARETAEAPLRTYKTLNEYWLPSLGIGVVMGVVQTSNFVGAWRAYGQLEPVQLLFGALPLAVACGLVTGYLGMRRVFSQQMRPLLRARPPLSAGLAARCRNCGGDLPNVRAAEVVCNYCGASNLLDATLTANAAALLAAEAEAFAQHARPWARDPAVYMGPARAFYRYAAIGAGVGLALVSLGLFVALRLVA